ncbi:hypothetical protein N7528_003950 [Penicillium herquei]|nr:hypothetical protein N7528_003950 [Penicillium herquei]
MSTKPDPVRRDGFESSWGQFRTDSGDYRLFGPGEFQSVFLPTPTPIGEQVLASGDFVRTHLKFFGIEFDESDISGNGYEFLKTCIEAGKFDEISSHILKLQADLHQEWVDKCTLEDLVSFPDWLLQKFFLTNGLPDRTKTKTVVKALYSKRARGRPDRLAKLALEIPGLHVMNERYFFTRGVFMAWDLEALQKADQRHWDDEEAVKNGVSNQAPKRDKEQHKAHKDYLDSLGQKKNGLTPVGSYIVGIELIESIAGDKEELFMEIYETDTPGLYQGDFDFGTINGIMMMSSDKRALDEFGGEVSSGDISGDELDSTIPANEVNWSSRRKEKKERSEKGARQGQKQKKASEQHPLRYFFKHRCSEDCQRQAFFIPRPGHVQFDDGRFCAFTGQIVLPLSDKEIPFTGYKIRDKPPPTRYDWDDFGKEEGPVAEPRSFLEGAFLEGQTMS